MWNFRAGALALYSFVVHFMKSILRKRPRLEPNDSTVGPLTYKTPCLSVVHVICITWLQSGLQRFSYIKQWWLISSSALSTWLEGKRFYIQRERQDFLCLQQPHWPWQASWSYLWVVHRFSSSGNIGTIQNSQLCVLMTLPVVKHE